MVLLISAVNDDPYLHAMRNVDPGFSDPKSLQVCALAFLRQLVADPATVTADSEQHSG